MPAPPSIVGQSDQGVTKQNKKKTTVRLLVFYISSTPHLDPGVLRNPFARLLQKADPLKTGSAVDAVNVIA